MLSEADIEAEVLDCRSKIQGLIEYVKLKIHARDWHAVADGAMDIRDLEAMIDAYETTLS